MLDHPTRKSILKRSSLCAPLAAIAFLLSGCGDDTSAGPDADDDDDAGGEVDAGGDPDGGPSDEICDNDVDDDGDDQVDCDDGDCDDDAACDPAEVVGESCDHAVIAADPSLQTGDLAGHVDFSDGECQDGGGADFVYSVTVAHTGRLQLHLEAAEGGLDADLGLYVQKACGEIDTEIDCADFGGDAVPESLDLPVTAGDTLFVFVGGFTAGEAGPFHLSIESVEVAPEVDCDDILDNDLDGLIDCTDPSSCHGFPVCDSGDGAVGTSCTSHNDCQATGGDPFCISEAGFGFPAGYCSEHCVPGVEECAGDAVCIDLGIGTAICFDGCAIDDDCAPGYACRDSGTGAGDLVCLAACTEDEQCPGLGQCNVTSGTCTLPEICDNDVDDNADSRIDCEEVNCATTEHCAAIVADVCAAATPAVLGDNVGTTVGGTSSLSGECTGGDNSPEDVYSFTPGETGTLTLTLTSATDQGIYVRADCADPLAELACRDVGGGGVPEVLFLPVVGGVPLTIVVDGFFNPAANGPYTLNLAYADDTPVP
jgi:hypothetical protein